MVLFGNDNIHVVTSYAYIEYYHITAYIVRIGEWHTRRQIIIITIVLHKTTSQRSTVAAELLYFCGCIFYNQFDSYISLRFVCGLIVTRSVWVSCQIYSKIIPLYLGKFVRGMFLSGNCYESCRHSTFIMFYVKFCTDLCTLGPLSYTDSINNLW
jgi:hypothetical protein